MVTNSAAATIHRLFDLPLPGLTLEAGARVPWLVARGTLWGPADDEAALVRRALVLPDDLGQARPPIVIRRDAPGIARLRAAAARLATAVPRPGLTPAVPTVLVVHALTGDAHAGGPRGFWGPLIGPGAVLDPRSCRILCFNNLGSCYGTSGPADADFPRKTADRCAPGGGYAGKGAFAVPASELPATVTTWDQARLLLLALDALGIERVALVAGGSIGGMVALCLCALDPARFERLVTFGAATEATAWHIGWNHVGRQIVLCDPGFPHSSERGLQLARALGQMTYRAEPGLTLRHGRRPAGAGPALPASWSGAAPYAVQTYLEHQGEKLSGRFDVRAYLAQLDALDHHDLARVPPPPEPVERWPAALPGAVSPDPAGPGAGLPWGLGRLRASTLAVGISSDQLYFKSHMQDLAARLGAAGRHAEYDELVSPHGHDAFLIEWPEMRRLLARALVLPGPTGP